MALKSTIRLTLLGWVGSLLLAPAIGATQEKTALQELKSGQEVRVLLTNGHVMEGRIVSLSERSLVLKVENLGSLVQRRDQIERITDAASGNALGWKGADKFEEEIRKRNEPPPVETPPSPGTTPPSTTPPDTVANKSAEAAALQKRLLAWQESGFTDLDALKQELAGHGTGASAYLVAQMANLDSEALPAAGRALSDLKESGTVELLVPLLKAPRDPVRLAAVTALVSLAPTSDPYLAAYLDANADVRLTALSGGVRFTEAPRVQHAAPLALDPDKRVRVAAGNYLADWAAKQSMQWQVADWVSPFLAKETAVARRIYGIEFLSRVPSAEAVAALKARWTSPDLAERAAVAKAAGEMALPDGHDLVAEALGSLPEEGAASVIQPLVASAVKLKCRAALRPMIDLLEHPDPAVASEVLTGLQTIAQTKIPADAEKWTAWLENQPEEP